VTHPTLTIIIPVYNTKEYLPQCVESVLNQSYTDFELILVDDGSTDGSGAICDAYAEKDDRLFVFHKANGGVSSARNMGLEYARGVWVFFLDSDDSLPSQAIESLMAHSESDVDMVLGGIRKCDDLNDDLETIAFDQEKTISIEGALDGFVVPKQWQWGLAEISC
jgi:Glycosyltransferases involved in cell wall biogenesis